MISSSLPSLLRLLGDLSRADEGAPKSDGGEREIKRPSLEVAAVNFFGAENLDPRLLLVLRLLEHLGRAGFVLHEIDDGERVTEHPSLVAAVSVIAGAEESLLRVRHPACLRRGEARILSVNLSLAEGRRQIVVNRTKDRLLIECLRGYRKAKAKNKRRSRFAVAYTNLAEASPRIGWKVVEADDAETATRAVAEEMDGEEGTQIVLETLGEDELQRLFVALRDDPPDLTTPIHS